MLSNGLETQQSLLIYRAAELLPPIRRSHNLQLKMKSHLIITSFFLLGLPSGYCAACFLNRTA
jgi:hypothetical protein